MDIIILALFTWRIASLLQKEHGPFDVLDKFRHLIGVRYNVHSEMYGTNELAKGILCVWCSSVWIGAGTSVAYYLLGKAMVWVALPFALSTVAVIVEGLFGGE